MAVVAVLLAACGTAPQGETSPTTAPTPPDSTAAGTSTGSSPTTTSPQTAEILPRCNEAPLPAADPSLYRDTPKYVGNEMPADDVREWAEQYPDFVEVWIDREHNGWVSAGFTGDVAERQAEIAELFRDDGVVAVQLPWTADSLADLERRVVEELGDELEILGTSVDALRGFVSVVIPVLDDASLTAIVDRFPGERICVEGLEPENVVAPGPQPEGGDVWRLLLDRDEVGFPYGVGIAWDSESLDKLLDGLVGLGEVDLDVDFATEIVIWFGAVHGSSCPNLRLDHVVVDGDSVYAEVVNTDNAMACTMDAIPHTYVVAVERDVLPAAPFHVALSPDPSADRLLVEADLRVPGSTASPDQIEPDPDPPLREPEGSGVIIETGFPWDYTVDLACGFEAIGDINSFHWVTSEQIPDTWLEAAEGSDTVVVEVLLYEGPDPKLEVTFQGETLVYEPTNRAGCS